MRAIQPGSMKMDLSQWRSKHPNVKISPTKRKFYNRYLHKLVYQFYGANILSGNTSEESLIHRIDVRNRSSRVVNTAIVKDFYQLYTNENKNYRIRVEGNTLAIFAPTLEILLEISEKYSHHKNLLTEVTTVLDDSLLPLIEQNYCILHRHINYSHRINFKSGWMRNYNDRRSLANYLQQLGDEIRCSNNLIHTLKTGAKYFQGGYFYARDPNIASMIALIVPTLVKSIQQVVINP